MTKQKKTVRNKKSTYNAKAHNRAISKKRSAAWRQKAVQGRFDAAHNPTQLRVLRVGMGKAQDWMASQIKVPLSSYGTIERGKRKISEEKAKVLAKALSKSVNALFVKEKNRYRAVLASKVK